MKVTFPLMGTIELLITDLCRRLDVEAVPPPPISTKTVRLGVQYGPEFACLPLKITIGNFIEAMENGADTLIMAGGTGPCRFGYYAEVQKKILKDLGHKFEMIIVEPPLSSIRDFVGQFKFMAPHKSTWELWEIIRACYYKGKTLDEVQKKVLEVRAYEKNIGETSKAYKKCQRLFENAFTSSQIDSAKKDSFTLLDQVAKDETRSPLKVGIVGEFYVVLEPFINFDIEEFLGTRGIYVHRSVYLTDWIGPSGENPVLGLSDKEVAKAAQPYLSHFVGGEGQATVGHIVKFVEEGFDGVIHLFPFTCMPETIAKSIFPKITKDLGIPILSLVIDEQTGKAGVVTRLEAFIDLLYSKRKQKMNSRVMSHSS